jgi:DNA-binding response OmpR family regulator
LLFELRRLPSIRILAAASAVSEAAGGTVLRFAGFELDPQRAELRGPDRKPIRLRRKTLEMLRLFAANAAGSSANRN